MKTNELSGAALDWAVAKCEGLLDDCEIQAGYVWDRGVLFSPTRNWNNCGPIIEREGLGVWRYQWNEQGESESGWYAEDKDGDHVRTGTTPLIAAMRCYVASKLGDEVELPEGLR
jgi:hypothetical protein